ncbi:MAG: acylphosphatase [Rhodospirillales bacterium]
MTEKAVRVVIEGRVQGVWFRGWTIDEAQRRGLRGWVRNRRDGSVEALFAGEAAQVDDMVRACRRGPPAARVDTVGVHTAEDPGGQGFMHLPTA